MSITEYSVLPHGTRVRVKRGNAPADRSLIGQMGVVVEHSPYYAHKVDVTLDGDPQLYSFAPDELEVVEAPKALPPDKEAAKKRLARP